MNKLLTLSTFFILTSSVSAQSIILNAQQQTALSLTLYKQNLALIEDSRTLGPLTAQDTVIVRDVSAQMLPPSLQISNAGNITQQSLQQATLSYHRLLNSYIGKELTLAKRSQNSDIEQMETVKLLNVSNNIAMIENQGAIETIPLGSNDWRFIFPSMPKNMLLKPSLTFSSTGKNGTNNVQLSYLSRGMQWQMDYVLQLNAERNALQLKGLATLFNNTNTTFNNAKIRLLAGDIAQAPQQVEPRLMAKMAMESSAGRISNNQAQSLGDFYLYKLEAQTNLLPQQQIQVPLFNSEKIDAKVRYRHSFYLSADPGGSEFSLKPQATLYFKNTLDKNNRQPLAAGNARVFTPDNSGDLQFIGSNPISHTASGEEVALGLGKAFDLKITQRRTNYQKTFNGAIISLEIKIKNSAKDTKTLDILSNFGSAWELVSSTYPLRQKNAASGQWRLDIPGSNTTIFNLQVRLINK